MWEQSAGVVQWQNDSFPKSCQPLILLASVPSPEVNKKMLSHLDPDIAETAIIGVALAALTAGVVTLIAFAPAPVPVESVAARPFTEAPNVHLASLDFEVPAPMIRASDWQWNLPPVDPITEDEPAAERPIQTVSARVVATDEPRRHSRHHRHHWRRG